MANGLAPQSVVLLQYRCKILSLQTAYLFWSVAPHLDYNKTGTNDTNQWYVELKTIR